MRLNSVSAFVVISLLAASLLFYLRSPHYQFNTYITSPSQITHFFPLTVTQLQRLVNNSLIQAQRAVDKLISLTPEQMNFDSVVKTYDHAYEDLFIVRKILWLYHKIGIGEPLKSKIQEYQNILSEASDSLFLDNKTVKDIIKTYYKDVAPFESLTSEQQALLPLIEEKKELSPELLKQKNDLMQKINELTGQFFENLEESPLKLEITIQDLVGVDLSLLNLSEQNNGIYSLLLDAQSYDLILKTCTDEQTRKKVYHHYNQRGFPKNIPVLNEVVAKRKEIAELEGYESFAALNLLKTMAKNPETVSHFLSHLKKNITPYVEALINQVIAATSRSITVTVDKKINPWDLPFALEQFKIEKYNLLPSYREYFLLKATIEKMFLLYEDFFDIKLKRSPLPGLWDPSLTLVQVFEGEQLLGSIILDLFSRPGKFNSIAQYSAVIPAYFVNKTKRRPSLGVLIMNFNPIQENQPALLNHDDVIAFFHEFGHALHDAFGATELARDAGIEVKPDITEMPSQLLEEWLWDKDILQNITQHYETKKPLSNEEIDNLIQSKKVTDLINAYNDLFLSTYALELYGPVPADCTLLYKQLYQSFFTYLHYDSHSHPEASWFFSLEMPNYYSYLWSRVIAWNLFDYIKQFGLRNNAIGRHYRKTILEKGGSLDPQILIKEFIGKNFSMEDLVKNITLNI